MMSFPAEPMNRSYPSGSFMPAFGGAGTSVMDRFRKDEDLEYDEKAGRAPYEAVRLEHVEKKRNFPCVRHADVGYRVPLSLTPKRVPEKKERIDLLNQFY